MTFQKKCEQYWPEIGTRVKNGDILISTTNHQVFADYTFRTLSVRYGKETREVSFPNQILDFHPQFSCLFPPQVVHLHYTGWPDHGVPMYTQSLVLYLKKLLATSNGAGPIVVHCSAGVGRTGTIILCAICLRRAVAERVRNYIQPLKRFLVNRCIVDSVSGDRRTSSACKNARGPGEHGEQRTTVFTGSFGNSGKHDSPTDANTLRRFLTGQDKGIEETVAFRHKAARYINLEF